MKYAVVSQQSTSAFINSQNASEQTDKLVSKNYKHEIYHF